MHTPANTTPRGGILIDLNPTKYLDVAPRDLPSFGTYRWIVSAAIFCPDTVTVADDTSDGLKGDGVENKSEKHAAGDDAGGEDGGNVHDAEIDGTSEARGAQGIIDSVDGDVTYALLLMKKRRAKCDRGYWEMPGGHVEVSDTNIRSALAREVKEETDLTVDLVLGALEKTCVNEKATRGAIVKLRYVVTVKEVRVVAGFSV